jgi:ATP-binding cassette subfamily B protein
MNSRSRKFLSYYKPYLGLFLGDMLCALVVSGTALLIPLCANYITKNLLSSHRPDALSQIYGIGVLMLVLVLIHTACNMFVDYQGHLMGAKMERDMRAELFEHLQKLSFGYYDEQKTGQLMTRITNDSFALAELFHHGPEDIVISLLNFAGAFVILLTINVQLALIIFFFLLLLTVHAVYFNKKMKLALRRSHDRIGDINAQVEDTLAGIRVVQSFTNAEIESGKFSYENNRFLDSRRDGYKSEAYFSAGLIGFPQLMTIAVIIFGSAGILLGSALDLADLLTYLLCLGLLIAPVQRFGNFTRLYQEGIAGFERFMEVMEVQPEIQDASDATDLKQVQGHLEFRDVSFRYKEDHDYVLRNISLQIQAGEYIAVVGSSGVGKTTLCSLIPRFYEISAGKILLDGQDIRQITLRTLRRNIGVVQQDVYLFAGTVADNIR